jgi:hypothetical protein
MIKTNIIKTNFKWSKYFQPDEVLSPVCEACPYNTTESLQHFLLECPAYKNIRDQSFKNLYKYSCLLWNIQTFLKNSRLHFLLTQSRILFSLQKTQNIFWKYLC